MCACINRIYTQRFLAYIFLIVTDSHKNLFIQIKDKRQYYNCTTTICSNILAIVIVYIWVCSNKNRIAINIFLFQSYLHHMLFVLWFVCCCNTIISLLLIKYSFNPSLFLVFLQVGKYAYSCFIHFFFLFYESEMIRWRCHPQLGLQFIQQTVSCAFCMNKARYFIYCLKTSLWLQVKSLRPTRNLVQHKTLCKTISCWFNSLLFFFWKK